MDPTHDPDAFDTELPHDVAVLLGDPSLWLEPSAAVELLVVTSIVEESAHQRVAAITRRSWRRDPRLTALLGAAAAAVVVAAVAVALRPDAGAGEAIGDSTIAMTGTDLEPSVSGVAGITREASGVRVYVQVPGLPRRDGDEFYQGWLRSCDGERLAPIGSFHDLTDAIGWAGVDIDDFPILSFTREVVAGPQGTGQASSGEAVVRGELARCP